MILIETALHDMNQNYVPPGNVTPTKDDEDSAIEGGGGGAGSNDADSDGQVSGGAAVASAPLQYTKPRCFKAPKSLCLIHGDHSFLNKIDLAQAKRIVEMEMGSEEDIDSRSGSGAAASDSDDKESSTGASEKGRRKYRLTL